MLTKPSRLLLCRTLFPPLPLSFVLLASLGPLNVSALLPMLGSVSFLLCDPAYSLGSLLPTDMAQITWSAEGCPPPALVYDLWFCYLDQPAFFS